MSAIISIGPHWPTTFKHLVIFGASYCDIGYNFKEPHPTTDRPFGVEWPGVTWAEPGKPNWVGHLHAEYTKTQAPLLVYDYARGGDTVFGVQRQIQRDYLPHVALKPDWAPWTASDTLFMTWVGINDAAYSHLTGIAPHIKKLIQLQDTVYDTGARNFLFFNLPPMYRAPGVPQHLKNKENSPYESWNSQLLTALKEFAANHVEATVLLFSSWDTFARVLDSPTQFGFTESDSNTERGGIWVDHMHPTSKMHEIIAKDLMLFIASVPPSA